METGAGGGRSWREEEEEEEEEGEGGEKEEEDGRGGGRSTFILHSEKHSQLLHTFEYTFHMILAVWGYLAQLHDASSAVKFKLKCMGKLSTA